MSIDTIDHLYYIIISAQTQTNISENFYLFLQNPPLTQNNKGKYRGYAATPRYFPSDEYYGLSSVSSIAIIQIPNAYRGVGNGCFLGNFPEQT